MFREIILPIFRSTRLCVTACGIMHARCCRPQATPSHSAEHATHTGWHKRTGTFEMRSSSERMHTWRKTPSTGRNFQTLIIWITVSLKASCNGSISVNNFLFLDFFNFCWVFQKFSFFVSPCRNKSCRGIYCNKYLPLSSTYLETEYEAHDVLHR